jgi:hypothetical protein
MFHPLFVVSLDMSCVIWEAADIICRCQRHRMSTTSDLWPCILLGMLLLDQITKSCARYPTDTNTQDRFTTDFFLPDGSYGNVFTGYYSSSSGAIANLVSGDIALPNGQAGNIYSDTPQAKPVTSVLPVPTPWTSAGVGSAIPNSELGTQPTYSSTAAGAPVTPTHSLSFPSLTSTTAGPTEAPITLNLTGFPTYPTASMSEPYGYGPPPASNTSIITPSTGGTASAYPVQGVHLVICIITLASLVVTT